MPPKKRGKRSIRFSVPLTKEEKREAALERERALKRERLLREIELGALNTERYRQSWREMMIRAKMPVIKEDIETALRTFDRVLDNKDHSIQILMKAIDEAEEQSQRSKNSHSEVIDRLLNVYKMRTKAISRTYESKIGETLKDASIETSIFTRNMNESSSQVQCIIHIMEEQLDSLLGNAKSKTMSKVDAFVSDKTNVRRLALAKREKQLNNLSTDLRRVITKYRRGTKNRQRIYEAVKEKDERERQIITQQYVRISVLLEMISKLRAKMASHKAKAKKEIKAILNEQNFFYASYWIMKNRFVAEQKEDRVQLTLTAVEFKLTRSYLEQLAKKVESLLTIFLICHKYETLYEKVWSYTDYKEFDDKRISSVYEWQGSAQIINNFQNLTNFWRRIGIIQVAIEELKVEKRKLQRKVNTLREILKCYLSQENREIL